MVVLSVEAEARNHPSGDREGAPSRGRRARADARARQARGLALDGRRRREAGRML